MRIFGETQVLIAGGGVAGTVAAIAAARSGAKTSLIEKSGGLGGMSTWGLMNCFVTFHDSDGKQAVAGIAQEIVDRLKEIGASAGHVPDISGQCRTRVLFDPEMLKYVLIDMTEKAGVELILDSYVVDALVYRDNLRGVIVENKSGRGLFLADICIDATGDADLAAMAGALFEKGPKERLQPITLMFRLGNTNMSEFLDYVSKHPEEFQVKQSLNYTENEGLCLCSLTSYPPFQSAVRSGRLPSGIVVEQAWFLISPGDVSRGVVTVNATRVDNVDGTDWRDLSHAEVVTRRQMIGLVEFLRDEVPGFGGCWIIDSASQIGVRETRRVVGDYCLDKEDVLSGARFPDAIGKGCTPIDIHGGATHQGRMFWIKTNESGIRSYDIPYRCLVSRNVDNLLVAGRCISCTSEAQGAIRMMPVCMVTGQAAGTAAALACEQGASARNINVGLLQERLRKDGQIID